MLSHRIFPHFALATVAIIYGLNYVIAKGVMNDGHLSPFQFILLRVGAGVILFWLFFSIFIKERIDYKDLPYLILCAACGTAINQLAFFAGLNHTTPIHASLIMTIVPILVLIASRILIKERITFRKVTGIILGLCGAAYLISSGQELSLSNNLIKGDLFILINVTSYGLYLVLVKKMLSKYNAVTVVTWLFTIGFFMVLPFGLDGITEVKWHTFDAGVWWAIAYVLIGTTFLAYLLNAVALARVSPSTVSIYIYLQPFIATLASVALGEETLDHIKVLSGVLIFTGVYLVSFHPRKT
jgi:drug/metabolite transporter (DMT)-like permease